MELFKAIRNALLPSALFWVVIYWTIRLIAELIK